MKDGKALVPNPFGNAAISPPNRRPNHAKLALFLNFVKACPTVAVHLEKMGISRPTLRYWLKQSEKGRRGDGWDIEMIDGEFERFHVAYSDAIQDGVDRIEDTVRQLAEGTFKEILEYQGHVTYRIDPALVGLGCTGEAAYMRDDHGNPIPETKEIVDPEMGRFLLKTLRREKFGQVIKVDHEHKGGVLVVGVTKSSKELEQTYKGVTHEALKAIDVEFEEVPPEETGDE
jgi:hypothetical protein